MTQTLLQTKLYMPPVRPDFVPLPCLLQNLEGGLFDGHNFLRKLTLISAPPGFGKTTLIADWLQRNDRFSPTAWLSLEEADNDYSRFQNYFVAALNFA